MSRLPNSKEKEGSILDNDIYLTELSYSTVKCEEVDGESLRNPGLSKTMKYTQFGWPENNTDNKQYLTERGCSETFTRKSSR